jgi:predicted PurR-regulated permease PerM
MSMLGLQVLWAFAGQLMGAVITAIAKRIIDQSRPDERFARHLRLSVLNKFLMM